MQVRLTEPMLTALRQVPEIPDNLLARLNAARQDGDAFVMAVNQDEAMAMTEMCQWYIRKDPTTGQLGAQAKLFEGIVNAIYEAEGG
ncbi:MAG: hypothetical protein HYW06_14210 [Gemmatimonadetes bacterium]|nr:hypothetical protein [Gemmatimonadota bacterium]